MTGENNIRVIDSQEDSQPAEGDFDDPSVIEQEYDGEMEEDYTEEWEEDRVDEHPRRKMMKFVGPTIAIVGILAWTGLFVWVHRQEIIVPTTPAQWAQWLQEWSIPVLLIVGVWLLFMRNPSREASRFVGVTKTISQEAGELERRLGVVNRELSLAREFLAAESRDLESIGRIATERLSEHADRLHGMLDSNSSQIDHVTSASVTAVENMERLRDNLPVIANSAKDVSNQIGTAGRTAQGQISELNKGLEQLGFFGAACDKQVGNLQTRIETVLTDFRVQSLEFEEQLEKRFGELQEKTTEFQKNLTAGEMDALASLKLRIETLTTELDTSHHDLADKGQQALTSLQDHLALLEEKTTDLSRSVSDNEENAIELIQARVDKLMALSKEALQTLENSDNEAVNSANRKLNELQQTAEIIDADIAKREKVLLEQIAARRESLKAEEDTAISAAEERFAALDQMMAERTESRIESLNQFAEQSDTILEHLENTEQLLAKLDENGTSTQDKLSAGAANLTQHVQEAREAITGIDTTIEELTDASVRLLELIQASSEHSRENLPEAIEVSETRLRSLYEEATRLNATIDEANTLGESLSDHVIQSRETGESVAEQIEILRQNISDMTTDQQKQLEEIRAGLAAANAESKLLSEESLVQLRGSIGELEVVARGTPKLVEDEMDQRINALAESIGDRSASLIDERIRSHIDAAISEFEQSSERLAGTSRSALTQFHDQLTRVSELTANLENRVARARERAEEQVGNEFARRAALITEALHSSAIDISKALETEVTDTSWTSYLRGDRGIFTRRAVRLLTNIEAREIAEIYDNDPDFRDNVSRYIADFEAMLRTMLSTRDGNAISVTLLSSDMGKLYVILAQSIERLRE